MELDNFSCSRGLPYSFLGWLLSNSSCEIGSSLNRVVCFPIIMVGYRGVCKDEPIIAWNSPNLPVLDDVSMGWFGCKGVIKKLLFVSMLNINEYFIVICYP